MRKPRLLMMSDSPEIDSGNGRVTREVLKHLQKDFEIVSVIGWNSLGQLHSFPYHIQPVHYFVRESKEMKYIFIDAVNKSKPDVILVHGDIWNFEYFPDLKMPGIKKVGYITVDVHPLRPKWNPIWESFDAVATPSFWGKKEIEDATPVKAEVIYEGVDPDIFKPLSQEEIEKKRENMRVLCKAKGLTIPKFFVTMFARPMERKNLPAGIRALAKVVQKHADIGHIILYPLKEIDEGSHNMEEYNRRYLPEKMAKLLYRDVGPRGHLKDEEIAKVLSCSDVLLFPTCQEGFGLPVLEAMACGCVPIATDSTSMPELLGDNERGLLAKAGAVTVYPASLFECKLVDENDLAEKLDLLYSDPGMLHKLKTAGISWAHQHTWGKTAACLKDIILRTLDQREKPVVLDEI